MERERERGAMNKKPGKKICWLCENKMNKPDYKDDRLLRRFVTDRGKIVPRRITGSCAYHQRQITAAVKYSRHIAMLPFVADEIH